MKLSLTDSLTHWLTGVGAKRGSISEKAIQMLILGTLSERAVSSHHSIKMLQRSSHSVRVSSIPLMFAFRMCAVQCSRVHKNSFHLFNNIDQPALILLHLSKCSSHMFLFYHFEDFKRILVVPPKQAMHGWEGGKMESSQVGWAVCIPKNVTCVQPRT